MPHGIIPAYAGNTSPRRRKKRDSAGSSPHTRGTRISRSWCMPRARDHLRIRGEHRWLAIALPSSLGIIPAYAGNTASATMGVDLEAGSSPHTRGTLRWTGPRKPNSGDHPRIRGEHRPVADGARRPRGIIPAYAGNTFSFLSGGAHIKGSSPHTRGTPWQGD